MRTFAAIFLLVSIASLLIFVFNNNSSPSNPSPSAAPSPTFAPTPESTPYEIINSNTTRILIPNSGSARPYPSEIAISGVNGTIQKLTVEMLDLTHTCMSDIQVLLAGPNGQGVILMADVGGCDDFRRANLIFDDDALGSISSPQSGRYLPSGIKANNKFPRVSLTQINKTLSAFNGINPNGTWGVYVLDNAGSDNGMFGGGWKLTMRVDPRSPPQ